MHRLCIMNRVSRPVHPYAALYKCQFRQACTNELVKQVQIGGGFLTMTGGGSGSGSGSGSVGVSTGLFDHRNGRTRVQ